MNLLYFYINSRNFYKLSLYRFIINKKFIGKLTDFFTVSGVHLPEHDRDQFHFLRGSFSSQLKSKIYEYIYTCLLGEDEKKKRLQGVSPKEDV